MNNEHQRPEGVLIAAAAKAKGLSARQAAKEAGMSDARWRQIVNGYASAGAGQVVVVEAPEETLARMARVVDVTPEQLREVGRPDAADALLVLGGMYAESDWQNVGTALERLQSIREQLDSVIAELSSGGVDGGDTAPKTLDS
jgi:transcriptional regulator with XRE-family HTH domain